MEIKAIKVGATYTPYQLDNYQHCPKHWDLAKRWTPKNADASTARLIGSAVALGLEYHFKGFSEEKVFDMARDYITTFFPEPADRSKKQTQEMVRRGIDLGKKTNLSIKSVLGVEEYYNRNRPDLVIDYYDGSLIVIDHKVKMKQDDRYWAASLLEYHTSNQFYTYAYEVGRALGREVSAVHAHVIVLESERGPFTHIEPVKIDQNHLAYWLKGAVNDWSAMARIQGLCEDAEPRFTACRTRYGPCEMYELCHTFYGDENLAHTLYNPK